VPGEVLLIGIATVAVVVAGFAAIAPGLAPDAASWTDRHRIRLRGIVSTSFNVTFESLLPVALFPAIGDERTTIVVASALVFAYLLVVVLVRLRQLLRADALHGAATFLLVVAGLTSTALFGLNAVAFGSVTPYALGLLIQLSVSAISFYSLVTEAR
jgi:hypothetical protein